MNTRKEDILKVLDSLYFTINSRVNNLLKKDIGLYSGSIGVGLFLIYYGKFMNDNVIYEHGTNIIVKSLENIHLTKSDCTFGFGLSGIAWAIEFLIRNEIIENDDTYFLELDKILFSAFNNYIENDRTDFVNGALGPAIYFVNKRNYSAKSMQIIYSILEKMENKAGKTFKDKKGVWSNKIEGTKHIDLGLSHGNTAILYFLHMCIKYYDISKAKELLNSLSEYYSCFIDQYDPSKNKIIFPCIIDNKQKYYSEELSWASGDLIKLFMLFVVSEENELRYLSKKALTFLEKYAYERCFERAAKNDIGISFGSTGIALIFRRLYKYTNNCVFKNAETYWINKTIEGIEIDKNMVISIKKRELDWEQDTALVEGMSGVGLAIISFLDHEDFGWDEALLLI